MADSGEPGPAPPPASVETSALPLLAAAATGVQVGAAIVATRFVIAEATPLSLAFFRYAIGLACLLPAVLLAPRTRIERRDMLPIALLGIGQFGILIALLNFGLRYIPSARSALIFATFPLVTLLLSAAFGHERLTLRATAGVLLSIAGVALALGERAGTDLERAWIGDLAVFGSAFVGALCSVVYRPYLRRYPTLPVSALAMLAAVLFLALAAAAEGSLDGWPRFSNAGWAAVIFIGVSSGVGYYLWLWALGRTTATRVTIFLSLSPLTAAALGAWWLGEPVTGGVLGGFGCVALGTWLATTARGS